MSMLASASRPALRQAALRVNRAQPVRFAHHGYDPIPFKYNHKGRFALKMGSYLLFGFTLPGIAAAYQIWKSGA
ncbi:hypothetical protein PENSPDRAFT_689671 [Peniophora sp. CONT]|nr:hypothetical protein PENSPDRAFT_689671 [Peniophora sp. CONT]